MQTFLSSAFLIVSLFVFVNRMITLKVLNSIVLLGTSCVFVKEANMEEKLFDPPPSAVSSRANSRAHRNKHVHISTQQGTVHQLLVALDCTLKRNLTELLPRLSLQSLSLGISKNMFSVDSNITRYLPGKQYQAVFYCTCTLATICTQLVKQNCLCSISAVHY